MLCTRYQKCLLAWCNMYLFIICSNNAVNKWRTSTSNTRSINGHHKTVSSSFFLKILTDIPLSIYLSKCFVCFKNYLITYKNLLKSYRDIIILLMPRYTNNQHIYLISWNFRMGVTSTPTISAWDALSKIFYKMKTQKYPNL